MFSAKDGVKRLLIVSGYCHKDANIMHTVAVSFYLDDEGVIFEGCQLKNNSTTKAFYLTEKTGRLLLEIPEEINIYYLRPDVALRIESIARTNINKRKLKFL
jgi:hypothetical protein